MSCLSKPYRLNSSKDFNKLYRSGKKWHTGSFVAFFIPNVKLSIAFVTSKKIGNAVKRNDARRRMRALILENEFKIKTGKYIFVAKKEIENRDYKQLKKDFNFALKNLKAFNESSS